MSEHDYVVIRPSADLPEGWLPEDLDGRWYDRATLPSGFASQPEASTVAVPASRFEVRECDGAVAEVWEVRP